MPHILICRDRPGALDVRMGARQAHLDYVAATGKVKLGGPILDDVGNMAGSVIVLDIDDAAEAAAWAAGDPYRLADLFETVELKPFRITIG